VRIRNFKHNDAETLAIILHKAVHSVGRKDYSEPQVSAWSPAPYSAERFTARVSDGRSIFVAVSENDTPMSFIELEQDGHIDCFYCHPDVAGTGVGKALYRRLQDSAIANGISCLYVEASEAARRFFLREGFSLISRRDFDIRGVRIHNFAMSKDLALRDACEAG
jgi:putative acetyltransferase